MPITATGIGTGLDVEGLVSQLVLADVEPAEQRLNVSEAKYQGQVTAYGTIKGALSAFQSVSTASAAFGQYVGKISTSSQSSAVVATAGADASVGDYEVSVTALANAQSLASTAFSATTDAIGEGVLSISLGTTSYDATTDTYTSFSQKAGTTAVDITIDSSNNTLSGIRDAINSAAAGVVASIINDGSGYRLVTQSQSTGAENSVSVSVLDTGDSNNTDTSGLSRLAFNASATNMAQTQAAQNAQLTINGLAVQSAENTVNNAVQGLNFTLNEVTSKAVKIVVAQNTADAKTAVQNLVNGFNSLIGTLNQLSNYDAVNSRGSILTGDATLRSIEGTIRSALTASVSNTGGQYETLAELGITTQVADGTLVLDSAKLDSVLAADPNDVAKVLAAFGSPSNANIQFVSATANTTAGTYAVAGTTTTTSGSLTAGGPITVKSFDGSGNNAVFSISVDGAAAVEVTLSNNDSTTTEVLGRINTALSSAGVTASLNSDVLTFTSDSAGTSSSIAITAADANAVSGLGLAVATGTSGTSTTDYTINGSAVTRQDDVITGAVGTAVEGLSLKILGNASGDLGTIAFTLGVASPLDKLITDLLADDGLLDARLDGIATSITDITEQRSALELRAAALEKRYRNQFNGLETLISQLNTTQSFLTTALSQFVDPLSFKK